MIVGQRYKDGTVMRCIECGDSKNPRSGHFVVFDDGGAHCFRCGFSTRLPLDVLLKIAMEQVSIEEAIEEIWDPEPRVQHLVGRATYLDKFLIEGQPGWDSFEMRNANGTVVGYHNRRTNSKEFTNEGQRGIGYVGDSLISTPDKFLYIVEGVFDVLSERHVCVFGSIANSTLNKFFKLQWVFLWPDPDILATSVKRKRFLDTVLLPATDSLVNVMGIVVSDADPDEAKEVKHMTVQEATRWLSGTSV